MIHHNADGSDPRTGVRPTLHVARPDEATAADEMTMVRGWMTYLRASATYKLAGLTDEQIRWRPTPTANSLGGVVMHLGYGERFWVRVIFAGETMDLSWTHDRYAPTFVVPAGWSVAEVISFYESEAAAADAVLDMAVSMDAPSAAEVRPTTLRWILDHQLEEIARHLGHLDITRELIDGQTGR